MALSSTLRKSGWRVSIAGERRRRADRLNIPSGQISRETAQRWIPGRQGRQYHQGQRGRSSWTCACVCRVSQTEFTFVSQARVCLHTRRKPDATEKTNPACFSVGLLKRKKMVEEGDGCGRREVGKANEVGVKTRAGAESVTELPSSFGGVIGAQAVRCLPRA